MATSVASSVARIESFSIAIRGVEALSLTDYELEPSAQSAVQQLQGALRVSLPQDVETFLLGGLRFVTGGIEAPFASMGFDFLDAEAIVGHTEMLRRVAAAGDEEGEEDEDESDEHAELIASAVALTYAEPNLVLASDGAVYHFSFRNPVMRITRSFSEFLEHYAASGCFVSHDFDALWKHVGRYVESPIPPAQNLWLSAYFREFPPRRPR